MSAANIATEGGGWWSVVKRRGGGGSAAAVRADEVAGWEIWRNVVQVNVVDYSVRRADLSGRWSRACRGSRLRMRRSKYRTGETQALED